MSEPITPEQKPTLSFGSRLKNFFFQKDSHLVANRNLNHPEKNGNHVKRWPLFIGVIFILISIIYKNNGYDILFIDKNYVFTFVKEMGFALIVSYFVAIAVEMKAKYEYSRFFEEKYKILNRNIVETIYQKSMPANIFNSVENYLFNSDLYRFHTNVKYTIRRVKEVRDSGLSSEEIAKFEKSVFIDITFKYKLKNISEKSLTHDVGLFVEKNNNVTSNNVVGLRSMRIGEKNLNAEELHKADSNADNTDEFIKYSYPVDIQQNEIIEVELNYRMIKGEIDNEFWRTLVISSDLRFSITFPNDFIVYTDSVHPSGKFDFQIGSLDVCSFEMEMRQPLFPQNGVLIWWHPR